MHKIVESMGGLESVIKEKRWNEIAAKLRITAKTPAVAYALRTFYQAVLEPFITARATGSLNTEVYESEVKDKTLMLAETQGHGRYLDSTAT